MTGTRPTTLFPFQRGAMLESYHIFVEVASSGSMSQASSMLDLDVSVISRHVAAIEQAVGCALFERHRRGVRLTEAGAIVLGFVKQVLTMEQEVHQELGDLRELRQGLVRIVATVGAIGGPVTEIVRSFSLSYPGIRIKLFQAQRDEVPAILGSGEAELGIGIDVMADGLEVATSYTDELVAAVAPAHRLARREAVTPGDLEDIPVATCPLTSDVRKRLQRAAAEGLPEVKPALITDSLDALRAFAEDGAGAAIVCRSAIRREAAARRIVGVPLVLKHSSTVEVSFCTVQKAKSSFALTAFFAEAEKMLRRQTVVRVA